MIELDYDILCYEFEMNEFDAQIFIKNLNKFIKNIKYLKNG